MATQTKQPKYLGKKTRAFLRNKKDELLMTVSQLLRNAETDSHARNLSALENILQEKSQGGIQELIDLPLFLKITQKDLFDHKQKRSLELVVTYIEKEKTHDFNAFSETTKNKLILLGFVAQELDSEVEFGYFTEHLEPHQLNTLKNFSRKYEILFPDQSPFIYIQQSQPNDSFIQELTIDDLPDTLKSSYKKLSKEYGSLYCIYKDQIYGEDIIAKIGFKQYSELQTFLENNNVIVN